MQSKMPEMAREQVKMERKPIETDTINEIS
jgi:hypothetical protein